MNCQTTLASKIQSAIFHNEISLAFHFAIWHWSRLLPLPRQIRSCGNGTPMTLIKWMSLAILDRALPQPFRISVEIFRVRWRIQGPADDHGIQRSTNAADGHEHAFARSAALLSARRPIQAASLPITPRAVRCNQSPAVVADDGLCFLEFFHSNAIAFQFAPERGGGDAQSLGSQFLIAAAVLQRFQNQRFLHLR